MTMRKNTYFFLLIVFFYSVELLFGQPKINSFTPVSGPVGTIVTIYGSSFSSIANNNIVYFGAVKANVVNVDGYGNWINVLVPTGSTYQPITITVNGLIGYSAKPFIQTFPNGGTAFSSTSMMPTTQVITSGISSGAMGDFDNDGKTDIIGYNQSGVFSINRNTSSIGSVSFAPQGTFTGGYYASRLASADIDGDGKLDLVSTNSGTTTVPASSVYVFRNTNQSIGSITFAQKVEFLTATQPIGIYLADLDGDGKPEIVTISSFSTSYFISILRNTSTIGNISFSPKIDINFNQNPGDIFIEDIDNDGKRDLLVTSDSSFFVYKNTSLLNSISFAPRVGFFNPYIVSSIIVGDIDLDSKPDVCISTYGSTSAGAKVLVYKNTSSNNILSFANRVEFSTALRPREIVLSDINGDSKLDILTSNDEITSSNTLSILINSSTVGNLSFANYINFSNGSRPSKIFVCDYDGDNKPDVINSNSTGASTYASIRKNRVAEPIISSFSPTSAAPGATITITGVNFINISAVSIGGQPVTSYTVVSPTTITAVVPNYSSGNTVTVTSLFGSYTVTGFTCSVCPKIYSIGPISAPAGAEVGIGGVNLSGATQVLFGGVPATSFTVVSSTNIVAFVGNGNSGVVSVVTPYGTAEYTGFNFIPPPIINSIQPISGCAGTLITIIGNNFESATPPKFGGTSVVSYSVVSPNLITATLGNGSSGNVTVTTPGGSAAFGGFVYNQPPVISQQPTSQSTCSAGGASFVVVATGSNLNYQWKKGADIISGAIGSTLTLENVQLTDVGDYSCLIWNNCGSITTNLVSLFVNQSTTVFYNATSCGSYLWPIDGQSYTSSGTYTHSSGCEISVLNLNVECSSILNLKLLIEGFYSGDGQMNSVQSNQGIVQDNYVTDNIMVELKDAITYELVASKETLLHTDGSATVTFTPELNGLYYIVVKHRNSIETWSANPIYVFDLPIIYDFTSSSDKAYGDNLVDLGSGFFALYSGDINQDGNVDNTDYSILESDLNNFTTGYSSSDLNGDGNVDNTDYSIFETNSNNFIFKITPFN